MQDTANNVIDARLSEALGQYFNGVTLRSTVGDCTILSGVRKQNGAPVSIYTPSFSVARDDAIASEIGKAFAAYDKLANPRLQATERLLTSRAFKKTPALAVLSCPVPVFDDAFDTLPLANRLHLFDEVLEGLAALHGAGLVHGNLSPDVIRREAEGSGARLCELTFSGERSTTVTSQPAVYQSRHVINTTQPRAEDDVHAAGFLGYRILMGPDGPARVLNCAPDDPEAAVAAILGETSPAPTAEELFPDGHESGDQIARLLARMTGRLENASPYSNADAARRAFRTVLSSPGQAPQVEMSPIAAPSPVAAPHQTIVKEGVSRAIAITVFAGFLTSTAAACYLYLANADLKATLGQAIALVQSERATFARTQDVWGQLRLADRTLAIAEAMGAARASDDAADAAETARTTLAAADSEMSDDLTKAAELAETAHQNAETALSHIATVRKAAETARTTALDAGAFATLAAADPEEIAEPMDLSKSAEQQFTEGTFQTAATTWSMAATVFVDVTARRREAAEAVRAKVQDIDADTSSPQTILAQTYVTRASAAFDQGRFGEAEALYKAALAAFGSERPKRETRSADTRTVMIGDDTAAQEAAIRLCHDAAPIAKENCPNSRPEGEAAREVPLRPFALDKTEVSAGDFGRFVRETGYVTVAEESGRVVALTSSGEARLIDGAYSWSSPGGPNTSVDSTPNRPVTNIALRDAQAYCSWADARLPTEAEWETTASAAGSRVFPWGAWADDAPVWRGAPSPARRLPTPVSDAGGAGPDGHQGLSGNAREWVLGADGPVLKGGSWNTANPADLRAAARLIVPGNAPGVDFGLRCARDLEVWP